jgi:hypothetical protein
MRRAIAVVLLVGGILATALAGRAAAIPGWNGSFSQPHICLDDVIPGR